MIDSLLGLVMLMLLTGWMAGVVSVQAMLSSPARGLAPREQVDVLAALQASTSKPSACQDLVSTAKESMAISALQKLLLSPRLMVRDDDQTVSEFIQEQSQAGELPYGTSQDLGKFLKTAPAGEVNAFAFDSGQGVNGDWLMRLSWGNEERLFLCD